MAMSKFFTTTTTTTILTILLASIAMLATTGVTEVPISAPASSPELEECYKTASFGKCKDEFVIGTLEKGYVVKRCCDVLRDVGKDCFIGILKTYEYSTYEKINWASFWNNSTKILNQCQLSS